MLFSDEFIVNLQNSQATCKHIFIKMLMRKEERLRNTHFFVSNTYKQRQAEIGKKSRKC